MHSSAPFVDLSVGSMIPSRMMHGARQNERAQLFLGDIFRQSVRRRFKKSLRQDLLFLLDHV
jgi:hypothetical protein